MKWFRWTPYLVAGIFIINAPLQTWLAWNGSNVALIALGVNVVFLACVYCIGAIGWRNALEGWGRSTTGWGAAQTWGMKQDMILRDVLKELYEFDEEAFEIHKGRSTQASFEYINIFREEDE